LTDIQHQAGKKGQGDGRQGQAGQEMDQHDLALRCGVSTGMRLILHLMFFLRKAFAAMVNIDVNDGGDLRWS
jgi:hypothetical protein